MIFRVGFFVYGFVFFGFFHTVLAADFTVNQQIGFDSTPPTVPGSVVAAPVATTQIDISWASSTDTDSAVGGYQVFRDTVQIATTSSAVTTYSDIALSPSTTYAYTVAAFDIFDNYTAQSATSSTTTLPVVATSTPTTTTSTTGGGGSSVQLDEVELVISDVEIETTADSAEVSFMTSGYSIASLVYGQSPQYELGSFAVDTYRKRHRFPIDSLDQGVRYYFQITATNQRGNTVIYEGDFVTLLADDVVPPANVSSFTAYMEGEHVQLQWKNPSVEDFDRVRLVANGSFYPVDQADGYLLYEGRKESFTHEFVRQQFGIVYYTIFAIDTAGNVSSGAVAHVSVAAGGEVPDFVFEPVTPSVTPTSTSPETSPIEQAIEQVGFGDIEFIQDARMHQGYQNLVNLDPGMAFTIRVAYESVPEHLKTIVVTFISPENSSLTYSYLLRINDDKTYYQATIDALEERKNYPFQISILDYQTVTTNTITGTISTVPKTEQTYAVPSRSFLEQLWFSLVSYWWLWILILLLLLFAWRISREREDNAV